MTHEEKSTLKKKKKGEWNPFNQGVYKDKVMQRDTKCLKFKSKAASTGEIKD